MSGSEFGTGGDRAEGLGAQGDGEVVLVFAQYVPVVVCGGDRPVELEFGQVCPRRQTSQERGQRVW